MTSHLERILTRLLASPGVGVSAVGISNAGWCALVRIQLRARHTEGCCTRRRSSLRLPGKSSSIRPIRIVRIPWPGAATWPHRRG